MQATHAPRYALGAGDDERTRLDLQAEYYRMATVDAMRWAGIAEGMDVLDLGCGTGAVACEAARLVGPRGSVLALDAAPDALASARHNATQHGLSQVRFEQADITQWVGGDQRFDAITGRLIMMYLPDPAGALRRLAASLRPGGVVLLQEFTMSASRQVPERELFGLTLQRMMATFRALGVPTDSGCDLDTVLTAAGLGDPTMMIGGRWERGPSAVGYRLLTGIVGSLAPAMIAHQIVTAAELDLATLEQRLREEGGDAGVCPPLLISAWARAAANDVSAAAADQSTELVS